MLNAGVWPIGRPSQLLPPTVISALNHTSNASAAPSALALPPTHHSFGPKSAGSGGESSPAAAIGSLPAPDMLQRATTTPNNGEPASPYRGLSKTPGSIGSPKAQRSGLALAMQHANGGSGSGGAANSNRAQTMLLRAGSSAALPQTGSNGTLSSPLGGPSAAAAPKVLLSGTFACAVVREVLNKWLTLFNKHSASGSPPPSAAAANGKAVPPPQITNESLAAIRGSDEYRALCQASILFQYLDLSPHALTHPQRLALYLNAYHCLLLQSLCSVGSLPKSDTERVSLYHGCMYSLHGVGHLSLAMFEHAMIRDSVHTPASLSVFEILPRFSAKSGKRIYVLTEREPLITFAISNGSRSSPPINVYDEATICGPAGSGVVGVSGSSPSLRDAARHYLSTHTRVDVLSGDIVLPQLLRLYRADIMGASAGSAGSGAANGSSAGSGSDSKSDAASAAASSIENGKLISWLIEHLTESQVFDIQSLYVTHTRVCTRASTFCVAPNICLFDCLMRVLIQSRSNGSYSVRRIRFTQSVLSPTGIRSDRDGQNVRSAHNGYEIRGRRTTRSYPTGDERRSERRMFL